MNASARDTNEQIAAKAFSLQAASFDGIYSGDPIIAYKRQRVRDHVLAMLPENSHILELNAGTGEDAIFFAEHGHRVHATDISQSMVDVIRQKTETRGLSSMIRIEQRSFTALDDLGKNEKYDLVFSNFAGLNCTGRLADVLRSIGGLVKPGGMVTLVILPRFCLWEILLVGKGKLKTATRRIFAGKRGIDARVEGVHFKCWYYNPALVKEALSNAFDLLGIEGLCTFVPPSYIEGFAQRYPRTFGWLCRKEDLFKSRWPWRSIGDYYIISFKKKPASG
ncbi:MAG TPA: class I SAM-dependent methyltransferase [Puia sp.]|nr:class I SAM-dependent methyltransferase [Puia sp.]